PLCRSASSASGDADARPSSATRAAYLDSFGSLPLHAAAMAPHQAIRFGVLCWDARRATHDEILAMRRATNAWMDAGALGLATGLDYQPAASASTDELVALCEEVARFGGLYAPHQRYNEIGRPAAYAESIEVGRRAGTRIAIAHEFVDDETEPILTEASRDLDISTDWYLYPARSTPPLSLLPAARRAAPP